MEILFLVLAFLMHGTANTETEVTGVSGENITITCSRNDLSNYIKYFCEKNCGRDDDVLIKSKEKMRWYSKGRYSIIDDGKTFRVKISQLTKKDAGTYWCGWKRWALPDHYEKVVLTVREGTTKAPKQDKPTTNLTEQFRPSTPSSNTTVVIIVSVSLALLVCAIMPLMFYRNWKSSAEAQNRAGTNKEEVEGMSPVRPHRVQSPGGMQTNGQNLCLLATSSIQPAR